MDYYEILGVSKDSTQEEIKKAYKKKAMVHHPDKGGSEEDFKKLQESYDVLSDENKRQNYDRFGTADPNIGDMHGDPFDIFSNIFGGGFSRNQVRRGSDLRISVSISLYDVINGCSKKIKYKRNIPCDVCKCSGGKTKSCSKCGGSGQVSNINKTPFGVIQTSSTCPSCNGNGKTVIESCKNCKGEGVINSEEIFDINLPPGLSNGQQMVMNSKGNFIRDGQPGDLIIQINEIKDDKFQRIDNNIYYTENISISDSVLGSKIQFDFFGEKIKHEVKPGTESGTEIKFRGKGIPNIDRFGNNSNKGDLILVLKIKIPKKLTPESKILFEELKKHEL